MGLGQTGRANGHGSVRCKIRVAVQKHCLAVLLQRGQAPDTLTLRLDSRKELTLQTSQLVDFAVSLDAALLVAKG